MAISFIGNALGGTTTTTSFSITLPATQAGDIIILEYTHRGTGDATLGGTYSGGAFTEKHDQQYASSTFSGKTLWSRATGDHNGQTVTGSGLTNSCAAIITIYRGAIASGDPLTDATIVGEQNASGNETQAQITTATDGAWVVLVVANSPDVAVTSQAATSPAALTARAERLSTGGTDTSIAHASAVKSSAGATGSFTWAQTDGASGSWAYAIKPDNPALTQAEYGFYEDGTESGSASIEQTYYFDASDAAATDPNNVWSNDANAFDGNTATPYAECGDTTNGSVSLNYLMAEGTNAPGSGENITLVRARIGASDSDDAGGSLDLNAAIYTDGLGELLGTASMTTAIGLAYSSYVTLSTPSGGWTWAKVQALETKIYRTGASLKTAFARIVEIQVHTTRDLSAGDSNILLRTRLQETAANSGYSTDDYQLRYSLNGGSYTHLAAPTNSTVLDNFNRSNEGPPPSSSWVNGIQIFTAGEGLVVLSNQLTRKSTGAYRQGSYFNTSYNADQEMTLDVPVAPAAEADGFSLFLRLANIGASTTDGYGCEVGISGGLWVWNLWRLDNNSVTTLVTNANGPAMANNDQICFRMIGPNLYLLRKPSGGEWSVILSANDSTYTAGGFMGIEMLNNQTTRFDNFSGGNSSPVITGFASANLTDGGATTNRLGSGAGLFVAGKVSEDGIVDNHQITANKYTEHLYALTLESDALASGDTLDFRLLRNGATTGMTYSVTPRITAVKKIEGLTDNFDDNSIDTTKWTEFETGTATSAETGATFVVTPPNATAGSNYAGLSSADPWTLTSSNAYVKVSTVTSGSTNAQTYFKIYIDSSNDLRFIKEGGTLYAQKVVAGVTTTVSSAAYSGTNHLWWRIREASGTTYWDTSSDGSSWTNFTSTANPIAVTSIKAEIGAGTYQSETSPGTAVFDNFNVAPSGPSTLTINVSDNITVTESTSLLIPELFINKSESITVTENVLRQLESYVSVSDTATLTEAVNLTLTSNVNVSDTVTITENIARLLESYISKSETATITESLTVLIPELYASVSDTATITESLKLLLESYISKSESVSVSEAVSVLLGIDINVNDTATITEALKLLEESYVNVSDTATITENADPELVSFINVSDSSTISESVSVSIITPAGDDLNVNVSDSITITENVDPELVSFISKSETATITEAVTLLEQSFVNVSDTATISENLKLLEESYVSKSDSITVTENVAIYVPFYNVSVSETVTISESLKLLEESYVSKSDTVTISENVDPELVSFVNVSDSATVSESIKLTNELNVSRSETVTISESLKLLEESYVNVSDTATITESLNFFTNPLLINVSDGLSVSESVTVNISQVGSYTVVASDSVTITENVAVQIIGGANPSSLLLLGVG